MTAEPSDEHLMESAQRGQHHAFSVLVSRHRHGVHRFCVKMAGASMADELLQETFTKLWQARANYRPTMPFTNYLYSIAANTCRSQHRGQVRKERALRLVSDKDEATEEPLEKLEARGEVERVNEALAHLPEAHREAVILRFSQELDSEALGEALGCNASTARSRVYFAIKKLRSLLGERP